MIFLRSITRLHSVLARWRGEKDRHQKDKPALGFVPTMGHLHEGHRFLLQQARKECQRVVCSIFINPQQFNERGDFESYPQSLDADKALVAETGCDLVFCPKEVAMYPSTPKLKLDFGELVQSMEGEGRPGHFNGVGLVLARFFHLLSPSVVYLGEKDWQQCLVVERLICDLGFDVQLRIVPTLRQASGLVYASRNSLLSAKEQIIATRLYQTLCWAKDQLQQGAPPPEVQAMAWKRLEEKEGLVPAYFCVVDSYSLTPVVQLSVHASVSLCVAAQVGGVRLIDHVRFVPT